MSVQMMATFIMIDVLSIIMAITMGVYVNSNFGNEFEVKTLRKTLLCFIGFLVCGIIWLLTLHEFIAFNIFLVWISNICSLLIMTFMTFYWCIFALSKLSVAHTFPNRRQYNALIFPLLIAVVLCAVSPLTGWIFTITDGGEYVRGPLFFYITGLQYIYDIMVCVQAVRSWIKEKDADRRMLCLVIGLFIFFPMIAGVVQIFIADTPVLAPSIMVALFLVFVNIQNSQIYNDALTGLNNRRKLFSFLENLESSNSDSTITVYMMDVNSFKKINDMYGHIEGDNALRILSDCLVEMAGKYNLFIAKYGGDEFVMIDFRGNKVPPKILVSEVNEALLSRFEKKEYKLSVSVAYAEVQRKDLVPEKAIDMADKKLYEAKEAYYKVNKA